MEGFLISKVVFSSCELGVFDLLLGAERPLSAEEISQAVGTSVDGTERLLAACAGLQLLNIHQDERAGTSMKRLLELMQKTCFKLSTGCSGALAKQCTSAYPECTVTIFDLPKVVRTSRENFFSEANRRIGFYEGDFFKDPLPGADLYILARILHDWTDQRCIELLQRVHQACRPGGSVLLVEALLYEDGSGPLTAQLYSLNMLVQTEGRERSAAQYAALLTAAGFTSIQHRFTGKIYDAVLARKE
ncbi:unnamed protein product, partial [Tetraodon nigroviridis]